MADTESDRRAESVVKPEGWISAPLPVLGAGPDAAHWSIRCADCEWWAQGYGLLNWAMEQLRDHRWEAHNA